METDQKIFGGKVRQFSTESEITIVFSGLTMTTIEFDTGKMAYSEINALIDENLQ